MNSFQYANFSPLTLAFAIISILAGSSQAASPVSNVGVTKVDAGALSIEQRMGYTYSAPDESDHKRFRMRQHLDYGWNEWYATRFIIEQDKRDADNLEHANLSVENRFQIFEKDRDGWDGGFRVIYGHRDGDKTPHEIDVRLMSQVAFNEGWEWRHNTVLEHDVGENAEPGVMLELRNQITAPVAIGQSGLVKSVRLGAEMFNDIGRLNELNGFDSQDHQLGPVAKLKFKNGYYLQTGYRAGLTRDSNDHLFKLFVGMEL